MDKEVLDFIINAISDGRTDIVRTLITTYLQESSSADGESNNPDELLNKLCCPQGTLLHLATKLDHVDIVRTLLSAGTNPNIQNSAGESSYELAEMERMQSAYIEELLKCAAKSNIPRILQLLGAGVCIDSQDSPFSGNTALHWAASYGSTDVIKCLLDNGAMVNITNSDGATPLHDAVSRKDIDVVKKLLESGADPHVKSLNGIYKDKTPVELADGFKEIFDLFLPFIDTADSVQKVLNGGSSVTSSSLESLPVENGIVDSVSRLSISSMESPKKMTMSSYISQSSSLPPFSTMSSPPDLITDAKLHLLWPLPQQMIQNDGPSFKLKDKYSVCVIQSKTKTQEVFNLWHSHLHNFSSLKVQFSMEDVIFPSAKPVGNIVCYVNKDLFGHQQCYKMVVTSEQIRISSSDLQGLHYGICLLHQLFKLYHGEDGIPPLYIEDWPVLRYRGVLLDMAVDARKPTVDTLKGQIKIFSLLKLNQIHFYFRLQSNGGGGAKWPYSNCDIISIIEFCRQCQIEPVPAIDVPSETILDNLADCVDDLKHLLALFSSQFVHIGPTLSNLFLEGIVKNESCSPLDVLQLSSDVVLFICTNGYMFYTRLLQNLPMNVIFVDYGYQTDYHYDLSIKNILSTGSSVCVGVGTSSWGSIAGCPETATNNIHKASQCAAVHGAVGMIVADWKTSPHHPPLCFSWPGIVLMAGLSWNSSIHLDFLHTRLSELLNHYVHDDSEQVLGFLTLELGRLEAFIHRSVHCPNSSTLPQDGIVTSPGSVLHQFLINPDSVVLDHFTLDLIQQAVRHIKKFEMDLKKAKPECHQKGEIVAEIQMAIDMQLFACKLAKQLVLNGQNPFRSDGLNDVTNCGIYNLPPISKTDLANRLLALVEQFRAVWLSRNLPCGLHASLYMFSAVLHKLIPNSEHFFSSAEGFVRR